MTLNLVERDAFVRGKDEGLAEGEVKGQISTLVSLVSDKLISLSDAVARSGLTEAEFLEKMNQSTK